MNGWTAGILFSGGLLCFLYGMGLMAGSLKNAVGPGVERRLRRTLRRPISGVLLGIGTTAAIQSSSAVTVLLIGLVHAGLLPFGAAIGVVLGADIGTTATAWLLTATVLAGKAAGILTLLLLVGGAILCLTGKEQRKRNIGKVFAGIGILLYGMEWMGEAARPLSGSLVLLERILQGDSLLAGIAAGFLFTALIQSSSAAIGILQTLSLTGSLGCKTAFPLILGINLGTCITAVLASWRMKKSAKRVALVHILIKFSEILLGLGGFWLLHLWGTGGIWDQAASPADIAVFHTLLNVLTALFLFPFIGKLERICSRLLPEKEEG